MSVLFTSTIDVSDRQDVFLYPIDAEYMTKQLLTRRSVMSEVKGSTTDVSYLFEAAKTMLQCVTYMMDSPVLFTSLFCEIVKHNDETSCPTYDFAHVRATGYYIHPARIGAYHHMHVCADHVFYGPNSSVNHEWPYFKRVLTFAPCIEDIKTENGIKSIDIRLANANNVLSYCENFPSPTIYTHWFIDEVYKAKNSIYTNDNADTDVTRLTSESDQE